MQTFNGLPLFEATVSEDETSQVELYSIALVDQPAVRKNFLAFSEKPATRIQLRVQDEERRIVSGVFMLCDTPLLRIDPETGDRFYAVYRKPAMYQMVQQFFRKGYQNSVNEMHDPNRQVSNVTVFESFISDSSRGVLPMEGFADAPDGSWFGSMFINDEPTWAKIKSGEFMGFSIEGFFFLNTAPNPITSEQKLSDDDVVERLRELLKDFHE